MQKSARIMSERAKAARAAYMREYRKKNRARILENDRKRKEKYWERKADEMEQAWKKKEN